MFNLPALTIEYVNELCEAHNSRIDSFINEELPKLLEAKGHVVKNHRCNMVAWFDVKIDMQSYKLRCYGKIREGQ